MATNSIKAGIFGSLGSLFGKLCSSRDLLTSIYLNVIHKIYFDLYNIEQEYLLQTGVLILQIISVILMLVFNATSCTQYLKSLQKFDSTLPATVISSATNFISSALLGYLFFNEIIGMMWWCGCFLIILGMTLIAQQNTEKPKTD